MIKTGGVTLEYSRRPLTMSKTEGGYWYHAKYFCLRNQSLFAVPDCRSSSLPILCQEKKIFRNETIFTTTRTKNFNKTTSYDILSCQIYFKTILLSVRYKISKKKDERWLGRLDHSSLKHRWLSEKTDIHRGSHHTASINGVVYAVCLKCVDKLSVHRGIGI